VPSSSTPRVRRPSAAAALGSLGHAEVPRPADRRGRAGSRQEDAVIRNDEVGRGHEVEDGDGRGRGPDAGMATAEYAIATLAACGFAGLLVAILRGDQVRGLLLDVVQRALTLG
jgi:hypothetical protein